MTAHAATKTPADGGRAETFGRLQEKTMSAGEVDATTKALLGVSFAPQVLRQRGGRNAQEAAQGNGSRNRRSHDGRQCRRRRNETKEIFDGHMLGGG